MDLALQEVSFVVPDQALLDAASILRNAGFRSCSQGRQCRYAHHTVKFRSSPPLSAQFTWQVLTWCCSPRISETLRDGSTFATSLQAGKSANVIFASDRRYLPKAELMNECMKKKLSTQTSKEEGNRSLLSKPPRRTYNTPPRVQRRRRSLLSPQIGNDIENHGVETSAHSFPLLTIHIRAFASSKWANQGLPLTIFVRS